MSAPPNPPPGNVPWPRWWQRGVPAVLITLAYGLTLYLLIWVGGTERSWMPFFSGLVLLPMAVAGVVTALSDPWGLGTQGEAQSRSLIVLAILLILTMVVFTESLICVAMALPFFLVGNALGTALALWLFRRLRERRARQSTSMVLVLPLAFLPMDRAMTWPEVQHEVTTVIEIAADIATVWSLTAEIAEIAPEELPFTFSHSILGVPQPVVARLDRHGPGAVRDLRWTRGVTFQELVTDWDEGRRLAWDFHFPEGSIPAEVEAHINVQSNYLRLDSGEYRLEPLDNGGTRLVLTTRMRIASPFNTYSRWWGDIFLNDFHHAVLTVVKARAEAATDVPVQAPARAAGLPG